MPGHFAAKQAFADDAPIRTVKVEFPADDRFEACVERLTGSVGDARSGRNAEKMLFVGEDGQPVVKDGLKVCWSFDERIHDGFYCASSLKIAQGIVEDPERHVALAESARSVTQ